MRAERELPHIRPSRKVDLGPDLQPGGSRPGDGTHIIGIDGDVQCMRAPRARPGRRRLAWWRQCVSTYGSNQYTKGASHVSEFDQHTRTSLLPHDLLATPVTPSKG